MLLPGLVSISFRSLSPREIIEACLGARLRGIEWGGDVHVPPDNLENARLVGQMTRDAGLEVVCYGSYFRCDGADFEPVVECALEMGAPIIRVWAGTVDAREASDDDWEEVEEELKYAAEIADEAGLQVTTEFHTGTLTSSGASTRDLLEACDEPTPQPNLKTLWQPLRRAPDFDPLTAENLEDLRAVAPFLGNVHVYNWADDAEAQTQRLPLQRGADWPLYVEELRRIGGERWMLLEFVPDDNPAILSREAAALRALIAGAD